MLHTPIATLYVAVGWCVYAGVFFGHYRRPVTEVGMKLPVWALG